ncbi:energy-coupling factor transporter transmembrane component T [uncultured Methanobrevibacter sp.]|uniref:energy-coupling factor transporter transmembrane component T n=1 Tax=uncultured Methanobrevibacter sp. TaxID=253161 RepID=UPI0025D6182D|nr:energy-coupling factor transporter transmembrane component T [uncultured Methanobrevibacter sp.]
MELTRIHPLVYLIYYFIMIVFAFIIRDPYFLLSFLILILVLISLQGISSELKNIMKLFLPLSILIIILNPLLNKQGVHKIYLFKNFFITYEAFAFGVLMSLALLIVILIFSSYNRSVTYQDMLYIFSKRLPVISMVIVMALRFVPLINSRTIEIQKLNKLKSNGVEINLENSNDDNNLEEFDSNISNIESSSNSKFLAKLNSSKKFHKIREESKVIGKIMAVTVSWSLEESMFTAKSMKARGYNAYNRTSYLSYDYSLADIFFLLLIIFTVSIVTAGFMQGYGIINIYPSFDFSFSDLPLNIYYFAFIIFLLPLIYLEIKERLLWH